MPHAYDDHIVPDDRISNDVGVHGQKFPHRGPPYRAATVRKFLETIAGIEKRLGNPLCGARVEFQEVVVCPPYIPHGWDGPDNAHWSGFGRWDALACGQLGKPLADSSMWHVRASPISCQRLGIQTRFVSFIRFDIEDRLRLNIIHSEAPSTQKSITNRVAKEA